MSFLNTTVSVAQTLKLPDWNFPSGSFAMKMISVEAEERIQDKEGHPRLGKPYVTYKVTQEVVSTIPNTDYFSMPEEGTVRISPSMKAKLKLDEEALKGLAARKFTSFFSEANVGLIFDKELDGFREPQIINGVPEETSTNVLARFSKTIMGTAPEEWLEANPEATLTETLVAGANTIYLVKVDHSLSMDRWRSEQDLTVSSKAKAMPTQEVAAPAIT